MLLRGLKTAFVVIVLVVAAALVSGVIIWHARRTAIATRLESLAQEFLIANDSTRIGISSVSGNPLGSLTLHNVSLSVRDGEEWRNFFAARQIRLGYSISELAHKRFALNYVELEEPVFSLTKGAGRQYLWPHFGKGGKGKSRTFEIRSLILKNGSFRIGRHGESGLFDEIVMKSSLTNDKDGLALNGLDVSFVASTWKYRVESCRGRLRFRDGKMWADSLEVRTAESRYKLNGYVGLRNPKDVEMETLLDTLSLVELRGLQKLSFLPADGKLVGRANILKKGPAPIQISSSLSGTYGTHSIESLETVTTIQKGKWDNRFHMECRGSLIEGTFNVGPGTVQECAVDFLRFDPSVWPEIFTKTGIPSGSLDGAFRFSGNSLTSPERKGRIQASFDGGSYAGVSFLEGNAEGDFDGEGRLVFSSIDFRGAGYRATASGAIGPQGTINLTFNASVAKLGEFSHLKGKFDIDGEIAARGELSGTGKTLTIKTDLEGKLRRTSPATVSGILRNARVEGELWPLLSLDAEAFLSPGELRGFALDSLTVQTLIQKVKGKDRIAKEEGETWCSPVVVVVSGSARAVRSDSVVSAKGVLECCKNGVGISVGDLVANLGELTWQNRRTIRLGWRDGTLEIRDLLLSSGQSRIELAGTFEPSAKRASGKLSVTLLDVHRAFGKLLPVAGKLDADVAFELTESEPSWEGRVDWSGAALGEKAVDSLSLLASVRNREIDVKKLELVKSQGRAIASGKIQLPMSFGEFVDSVSSKHSIPKGVQAKLDVTTASLNLSEFSKWHPAFVSLGGTMNTRATIEGFIDNPRMTLSLDAKDFRIKQYRVAGLELEATLVDRVCTISRLEMMERNARGEVTGSLPMALNLGAGQLSFPDGPINLNVKLSESDLSIVSLFVEQIASASGLVKGEAQVSGTLKNPTLKGSFDIANGSLRPSGREEVLENLDAHVTLNEKAIEVTRFTATQGEDGKLEGSGRIPLSQGERGKYSFAIKGKRITFGDPEDIALKFDCDLVISSVEVRDRGTYPKITGRIDVEQGIIAREFQASEGPQKEQRWLCDVEVEVPNNLWLKNINAEIELAGSLTARKDVSGLILLGSLTILRGKYYVFDNEFTISSGTLEFKDVGQINPEMNIQAETRASGRRVFLVLTGKLSEPNIALSSEDTNLSQTDILRLLTVGKYAAAEPGQTGEAGLVPGVTGSVGNYFLRQIERRIARELKWVDSIELGSSLEGAGSLSEVRWGLGKYITPELYLRYSQGLTRTSGRDVSVEYSLSNLLFLRGGVVSRDRFTGRERDEYSLDLRLKYEY
jgi:autotransporter translocation and assembly factor TamB